MKILHLLTKIVTIIVLSSSMIYSANITSINLVSESWENATNKDGTGFYWDLAKLVFSESNITVKHKIAPYARAVSLTKSGKMDAWVGSYIDEQDFAIYPKYNIDADKVYSISKKGTLKGSGEASIKDKKVAWVRGYDYDGYLKTPVKKVEVTDRSAGIKMVLAGRADALLDAKEEIESGLKEAKLKKSDFTIQKIMELKTFIAFGSSAKGKELAKIWDTNVEKLIKSGKLKKFYEKHKYTSYPYKK